jgi:HK97 gp10 family phage protein
MATTVTVKVEGLRELGEKLRRMDAKMQKRVAPRATSRASQIVKKAAIRQVDANPSIETGSLRGAIVTKKVPKSETQDTSAHYVTFRTKQSGRAKGKQRTAPHARFIEYGTVKMQAEPVLRPAFDQKAGEAQQEMIKVIREMVEDGA